MGTTNIRTSDKLKVLSNLCLQLGHLSCPMWVVPCRVDKSPDMVEINTGHEFEAQICPLFCFQHPYTKKIRVGPLCLVLAWPHFQPYLRSY